LIASHPPKSAAFAVDVYRNDARGAVGVPGVDGAAGAVGVTGVDGVMNQAEVLTTPSDPYEPKKYGCSPY
jgi:hypothetical protein